MRILIFSTYEEHVFLEHVIYKGLNETIGHDKVYFYSPNKITDNYIKYDQKTQNIINPEDIYTKVDNFDSIFFFQDATSDAQFAKILNKKTSTVKCFFDTSDDFFIKNVYFHPEIKYYFKRELYATEPQMVYKYEWIVRYLADYFRLRLSNRITYWNMPRDVAIASKYKKAFPFPLTTMYHPSPKNQANRKYDMTFIGTPNVRERRKYLKEGLSIATKYKTHKFFFETNKKINNKEYFKILQHTKVGLSTRGVGFDTFRYWEIPCTGAALLSTKPKTVIPNNFIDEEDALFFENESEMSAKFEKYVIKSDEWREIASRGQKKMIQYHTPKKRIELLVLKHIDSTLTK